MNRISIAADDRVFVLTGAGISAESGLPTFRAADGLWAGNRIEDVCTPEAWERNPWKVWEFYAGRRKAGAEAKPNPAHVALAELEQQLGDRFFLCTQNVDDLHERAGSRRLLHMHGELTKAHCETELRPAAGRGSCDLSQPGRGGPLRVRREAAPAHRLLRRDSAGDGAHSAGDRKRNADGGRRHFGIGLSGGQLCPLGAAARRARRLRGAGAAAECHGLYLRRRGEGGRGFARPFSGGMNFGAEIFGAATGSISVLFSRALMYSTRRKRSAVQSSSMATARTVSNPRDCRASHPVSRLKSHVYFFDVPLG